MKFDYRCTHVNAAAPAGAAPARVRVLLLARDGRHGHAAADAILRAHELAGVVVPEAPRARALPDRLRAAVAGWRRPTLASRARAAAAPCLHVTRAGLDALGPRVRPLRADLVALVGFPWILPARLLRGLPPAINVHPALLPRHRGVLPLFWVYHAGDRDAGVTVHEVTHEVDAGHVLARRAAPLPRAHPVEALNAENAERGAAALHEALDALAAGRAAAVPQDAAAATQAPMVRAGRRMADFAAWEAEQGWHFLAGLAGRWEEPLVLADGTPAPYGTVLGFHRGDAAQQPGTVQRAGHVLRVACRDGWVELAPR